MWLQRQDEASQHNGTSKCAELDEPMDFSQPDFEKSNIMPIQHDQRRVGPHTAHITQQINLGMTPSFETRDRSQRGIALT